MEDESVPRAAVPVVLYFDATCPFAWVTSREHRDLEPWYREFNDRAGPARVCAAAEALHGNTVPCELHTALGGRIHVGRNKDYDTVITESLDELGLPASLAKAAHTDAALRAGHQAGQEAVGQEAGTPVVTVDGVGFFGPVLTSVPKSEEAIRLFQATGTLAGTGAFAELKRGRGALDFR
ncbi:disulfide bond formation protein DsbA [Streptomyces sp. NPDC057136]|uniref:mycothiol-dependent nitroreductase Rv2466c family protein n=1 Tax=Streptomyces sp. NPDC057136 TaxID=3346029 RepID=UPI0036343410